jgi:hypothetical protein
VFVCYIKDVHYVLVFSKCAVQVLTSSGSTMAPGSTQSVTEMSTSNIPWGKGNRCVGLTNLPLSCADCLKIWDPQTPGETLRACQGL